MRPYVVALLWMLVPPAVYIAALRLTAPQGIDPSGRATLFGLQLMIWVCFGAPALFLLFAVLSARGLLPGTARLCPGPAAQGEEEDG